MENVKEINRLNAELSAVECWAAWYEGEEGWGSGADDDE